LEAWGSWDEVVWLFGGWIIGRVSMERVMVNYVSDLSNDLFEFCGVVGDCLIGKVCVMEMVNEG